MPVSIAIIWGISLAVALGLTLVAAYLLLDLVMVTAEIARLAAAIVPAGVGIERNTRVIPSAGGIVARMPGLAAAVVKLQGGLETLADGAERFAGRKP